VRVPVHGWYNSIKKIELSGKELISNYGKTERNHYVNIPSLKKLCTVAAMLSSAPAIGQEIDVDKIILTVPRFDPARFGKSACCDLAMRPLGG